MGPTSFPRDETAFCEAASALELEGEAKEVAHEAQALAEETAAALCWQETELGSHCHCIENLEAQFLRASHRVPLCLATPKK